MLERINGLADNVAGFRAAGIVTKDDYDRVVLPTVSRIADKFKQINFLMVMDTDMKNFTWGAWVDDALIGLRNLSKWGRIAFVADSAIVKRIAGIMDKIVPGEYKAFPKEREADAINWVAGFTP